MQDAGIAVLRPHRILRRAHAHAARRDAAGRRRGRRAAARRARHDASAAARTCRRRSRATRSRETLAIVARDADARSSASRRRASPSAASIRTPAKAAISGREEIDVIAPAIADARARGHRRRPARCPPTRSSCRDIARALRRDRRDVPRPGTAGAEGRELRPRRQRDARPAVHPHVGRSRHGARSRAPTRRARAPPIRAACSRPSTSRSSSRGASAGAH